MPDLTENKENYDRNAKKLDRRQREERSMENLTT